MQMAPVAMVTDPKGADLIPLTPLYGNSEGLRAVGGGDDTTVTIGLLLETLAVLYKHLFGPIQFLIPLYRAEVGCTEQYCLHILFLLIVCL